MRHLIEKQCVHQVDFNYTLQNNTHTQLWVGGFFFWVGIFAEVGRSFPSGRINMERVFTFYKGGGFPEGNPFGGTFFTYRINLYLYIRHFYYGNFQKQFIQTNG